MKVLEKNLNIKVYFLNNTEEWDQLEQCPLDLLIDIFQKNYKNKSKFVPEGVEEELNIKEMYLKSYIN